MSAITTIHSPLRGRGTAGNPRNRFAKRHVEREAVEGLCPDPAPTTEFFQDRTKGVLSHNDSPDVPFDTGLNPYRGCEHGCVYCYARPTHEYLGFSSGLDFESRIMVKEDAPRLLRKELSSPRWKPRVIAMSGVTDPYQPAEKRLRITRQCLEVMAEFRNPVAIITKSRLVTRDIDVLGELARHNAAVVCVSVTSLDPELARTLEPRASAPTGRLAAIEELAAAGIPVGVMMAPIIPGLTEHEIPSVISEAARAGAKFANYTILRLPYSVGQMFEEWLATHRPDAREKVMNRLREMRDGKLTDPRFGARMRGEGVHAENIHKLFGLACKRAGLVQRDTSLSVEAFRRASGDGQLSLFEEELA
ncbi:MAG: PA0069 family radical SAM protein [Candidatus Sumerlaeaceae bacterium]|nr:PA0069 family radical SAM protein [Candidatus Sumerlaeaceae bacterium]